MSSNFKVEMKFKNRKILNLKKTLNKREIMI